MNKSIAVSLAFGVVVASAFACSGSSPADECNKIVQTTCDRLFECLDQATLTTLGYSSEADCDTKLGAQTNCANAQSSCPAGTTYNGSMADQCVNDYKALTCDQLKTAGSTPASCSKVCQ